MGATIDSGRFILPLCKQIVSNGDQVSRVASLAMKRGKSVDFTGYRPKRSPLDDGLPSE
jgi:hypothetical protein